MNENADKCNSTAYYLLIDLSFLNFIGIPPDYKERYDLEVKELIESLTNNVDDAISFIKTLDLNKESESIIMIYVDSIEENLKTQKEKDEFEKFISSLEEKFPDCPYINWNCRRFYKAISAIDKFLSDLKDSDNSDDEES